MALPTLSSFELWITGTIISVLASFGAGWYYNNKRQKSLHESNIRLERDINQKIGDVRGKIPVVVQVDKPTIYIGTEFLKKMIAVAKKDEKLKSVVLKSRREREISGVEFAILRDAIEKDLKQIKWLEKEFKQALISSLSFLSSKTETDYKEYSPEIVQHMKDLEELFENNRLNHLIIPKIKSLEGIEADKEYKLAVFKEYYTKVKENVHGNMIFIGNKAPRQYLDRLKYDYVYRNLTNLIFEARGENIKNAIDVANQFVYENPSWMILRADFSIHEFEGEFEESVKKSKIWIECIKSDNKEIIESKRKFLNELLSKSCIGIEKRKRIIDTRKEIYGRLDRDIGDIGYAVLYGEGEFVSDIVFLASSFRRFHPDYDYICEIDAENGTSILYIVFSRYSLEEKFIEFLKK